MLRCCHPWRVELDVDVPRSPKVPLMSLHSANAPAKPQLSINKKIGARIGSIGWFIDFLYGDSPANHMKTEEKCDLQHDSKTHCESDIFLTICKMAISCNSGNVTQHHGPSPAKKPCHRHSFLGLVQKNHMFALVFCILETKSTTSCGCKGFGLCGLWAVRRWRHSSKVRSKWMMWWKSSRNFGSWRTSMLSKVAEFAESLTNKKSLWLLRW